MCGKEARYNETLLEHIFKSLDATLYRGSPSPQSTYHKFLIKKKNRSLEGR